MLGKCLLTLLSDQKLSVLALEHTDRAHLSPQPPSDAIGTLGYEAAQRSLTARKEVTSSYCPFGIRQTSLKVTRHRSSQISWIWFTLAITFSTHKFKVVGSLQIIMTEKQWKAHFWHFLFACFSFLFLVLKSQASRTLLGANKSSQALPYRYNTAKFISNNT